MDERYLRTISLLGEEAFLKLKTSHVAVFGIGGVGGHLVEALARSGVGTLSLFDMDDVSISNINRQAVAYISTLGVAKVDVMKEKILDIDPSIKVHAHKLFYLPETADDVDLSAFDYIGDAIDNISAKLELITRAKKNHTPIISAMSAGNKLDATRFEVSDIKNTSVCPIARIMRKELKSRDIDELKVVYSKEPPVISSREVASVAFVPSVMGLIMAGEIVRDITGK
ncbi:MAG: tRNA threonylcarbamoyladenosine dehydratase [Clostridia bacterium]|nr:tRNA threonylcarbamoyladenosine dehydratase [Clostridia bacterium]